MRRTASLLTAALLLGGLAACGGDDAGDDGASGATGCHRDRLATTQAVFGEGTAPTTYRVVLTDDTLEGVRPVTADGVIATDPTFSKDGQRLAYVHHVGTDDPYGAASAIWTIDVAGEEAQRVTGGAGWSDDPDDHADGQGPWDIEPDWSPTENMIAFTHVAESPASAAAPLLRRLYTVVPGQEPALLLADSAAEGFAPAWSPDGNQIAFLRGDRAAGQLSVWLVGKDGKGSRKVTDTGDASELIWSPDGTSLSVGGKTPSGGQLPLRLMSLADGSTTNAASSGAGMSWSLDGLRFYNLFTPESGTAVFNDSLSIVYNVDGEFKVDTPTNTLSLFQRPQLDGLDVTNCPG